VIETGNQRSCSIRVSLFSFIPNFTSNWLADKAKGVMPTPFNGVDRACIVLAGGALVGWTFWPEHNWTGGAMIAAGIGHVARCLRWAGWRTLPEPLLAVLHIAYLFVPAGFISLGLSIYFPNLISGTASMHLWTAGTVGLTTTAIMARAVLGHTGAPLRAGTGLVLVFVLVVASAMARYLSGFAVDPGLVLTSSAMIWTVGFFWLSVLVGRSGDTPN
jgi:uncharacterized protein involved in response to NO